MKSTVRCSIITGFTCIPDLAGNETAVPVGVKSGSATHKSGAIDTLSLYSMVAGIVCAALVIIILIVVLLLKKRNQQRRESVPTLRPGMTPDKDVARNPFFAI